MPQFESITMPQKEAGQIEEILHLLQQTSLALVGSDESKRVDIPSSIHRALRDIVTNMQQGKSVLLIPEDEQLSTQKAADILGVSRPHFVKLIESGKLPFTKAGSHRRVLLRDVTAYAEARDAERSAILNQMARAAFERGDYEGVPIPEDGVDE
jgi:excisionase family DNA binding protein